MGFLRRGGDGEDGHAESRERIEAGGIPVRAQERLQALGAEGSLFTSGLSVNEFALLARAGREPLAQVMGASVVRTGWQYLPALAPGQNVMIGPWYSATSTAGPWRNRYTEPSLSQIRNYQWHTPVVCELDVLSGAWNMARRRALDRLAEEALHVGGDGVVGVRLQRSEHDLGRGTIEYVVTGTAIRAPDAGQSWPTLSDVSVQDYWKLLEAGHEPTGLVATTAVVFASAPRSTRLRRVRTTARNQELEEISRAFTAAREVVRDRLRGQIADARGDGAVGVTFSHAVRRDTLALESTLQSGMTRGWHRGRLGLPYFVSGHSDFKRRGWVITMHAAGTAIRRRPGPPQPPPATKTTMRMGAR